MFDLKIKLEPKRQEGDLRTLIPLSLCMCSRCTAEDLWTRLPPQGFDAEPSCAVYTPGSNMAPILSKPLKDLWRPV